MQHFNVKMKVKSNQTLRCKVQDHRFKRNLINIEMIIEVETQTNLSDGLFDSDLIVHGHH